MTNIELKKDFLKEKINQYIIKMNEKGMIDKSVSYGFLITAIDFATCDKSIEKVNHLYNIRVSIEEHIKNNKFDKNYKKLNEKLVYFMDKLIDSIYLIDFVIEHNPNQLNRVAVFDKKDLESFGEVS
jgi:hypothetical protein